jgi:hypothetical protein
MYELLNDDNFVMYAAKKYTNLQCTTDAEFFEDLARIKYIKKLLTRYIETGELKDRLILNHLTVLNNVFGYEHLPRILYLKMEDQFNMIKPFLIQLNIMPDLIENVKEVRKVDTAYILMDPVIVDRLRRI